MEIDELNCELKRGLNLIVSKINLSYEMMLEGCNMVRLDMRMLD